LRTAIITLMLGALSWAADSDLPKLTSPIAGVGPAQIRDTFSETHNGHIHEASDIMSPAGTPIHAAADGMIRKLFLSKPGGITIYEFDEGKPFCYYYAHLQSYAPGLKEGMQVRAGDVIGFVGSTGNAVASAPHLHFAITRIESREEWWKGASINPYFALLEAAKGDSK
jgi:murein DD-endopeptidase MepM/ murein hydrolase activator NlpD